MAHPQTSRAGSAVHRAGSNGSKGAHSNPDALSSTDLTPPLEVHPAFTRLDKWHVRHDETGLVIHWQKRKIVDITGSMYKKQFRDLTRALDGHTLLYEALKSDEVPGNWIHLADTGISEYLNLTRIVMCGSCKLYCNTDRFNTQFQEHILSTPRCRDGKARPVICHGGLFYGNVKKNVYFVILDVDINASDWEVGEELMAIERQQQEAVLRLQSDGSARPIETKKGARTTQEQLVIEERVQLSLNKAMGLDQSHVEKMDVRSSTSNNGVRKLRKVKVDATESEREFESAQELTDDEDGYTNGKVEDETEEESLVVEEEDTRFNNHDTTQKTDTQPTRESTPPVKEKQFKRKGKGKRNVIVTGDELVEHMLEDVDGYITDMCKSITEDFEEKVIAKTPELSTLMSDYFTDPFTCTTILPYVLLDCITDDLWNTAEDVSDNFRFVLRGKGPELLVTSEGNRYPLALKLSNKAWEGDETWSACVTLHTNEEFEADCFKTGEFAHEDKLETANLGFPETCEILVVFRALVYTVVSRVSDGDPLPDRAGMCQLVSESLENHRCGPELSVKIVGEKLYEHVSRWKK